MVQSPFVFYVLLLCGLRCCKTLAIIIDWQVNCNQSVTAGLLTLSDSLKESPSANIYLQSRFTPWVSILPHTFIMFCSQL